MSDNNFQENPYLSARKEYSDRYGSAVKDAARWRQISILMVLLCLAFGGTMMWLASQNKVVPYIVQVDKQGYAVAIKSAREGSTADTRVVVAALGGFFVNFKTVVTDVASQRRMVNDQFLNITKNIILLLQHKINVNIQFRSKFVLLFAPAVMISLGRFYGQKKK